MYSDEEKVANEETLEEQSGMFISNSLSMDPVYVSVDGREGQGQRAHSNGTMEDFW